MWGVFGRRKSLFAALLLDSLIGLAVMVSFASLVVVATWDWTSVINSLEIFGVAGIAAAMIWLVLAWLTGPLEIRDTIWAFLDINGGSNRISNPPRGDGSSTELA